MALPASPGPRFKRLTPAEMAAKRERNECYNCSEKFSKEHLKVCPMKGVYLIQLETDETEEEELEEHLGISLHAITGISSADTMQLDVTLDDTTIRALVDSGSTHSFLSAEAAQRLKLQPLHHPGLYVTVANGDRVASLGVCKAVRIYINQEEFVLDLFVIPLEGYDLVLGVHWLRTLGPILWDFERGRMAFWHDNHRVLLQGVVQRQQPPAAKAIQAADLLHLLCEEFQDLFKLPQGLPPARRYDHRIHLLPDTAPVAVRPYRYLQLLKDEIEKQCTEMLQQGIIRASTSAFSSPVLLVKK